MTKELNYQQVLHNDKVQIDHLKKDYESETAKGLIHGLQKDAIQNAVGAAATNKFRDWKITFELCQINGKDALIFKDEGTIGLEGDIIPDQADIMKRVSNDTLGPNEHLSRFRTVFVSGKNTGPGSYGRGKLVFQACSKSSSILVDSLRKSDNKYIAFKRCLDGVRLVESEIMVNDDAERLISNETSNSVKKLTKNGTRIIILDLSDQVQSNGLTIRQSFERSFEDVKDEECILSFDQMIMETWWELLEKCKSNGAKIILKHGNKEKEVEISSFKSKILYYQDNQEGWRIYEKLNLPITIDGDVYKIKQLRFYVSPQGESIAENFRMIFSQRKKMKIGEIGRRIFPHTQIQKNFGGFVVFDEDLDDLVLEPENLTHSGYDNMKKFPLRPITELIQTHLDKFHKILKLDKIESDGNLSKALNDALKDINERASELGLVSSFGSGSNKRNFDIKINNFVLPRENTLRVEYDDLIGPIDISVVNNTDKDTNLKVKVYLKQQKNDYEQVLLNETINSLAESETDQYIEEFSIDRSFNYGVPVNFCIDLVDHSISNSRFLWLGIEPEERKNQFPLRLKDYRMQFARDNSRRMEVGESFKELEFSIVNDAQFDYSCELRLNVIWKSPDGPKDVVDLISDKFDIIKMTDRSYKIEELVLDQIDFGFIEDQDITHRMRTFELQLQIVSSIDSVARGVTIGQKLMQTKSIKFYIGIDDPGMSIFSEASDIRDDKDPRRSWWKKDSGSYKFYINVSHPYFLRLGKYNELKNDYIKEEMLKAAYEVCLKEEIYSGVFEDYNKFTAESHTYEETFQEKLASEEAVILFDELVGRALQKLYE